MMHIDDLMRWMGMHIYEWPKGVVSYYADSFWMVAIIEFLYSRYSRKRSNAWSIFVWLPPRCCLCHRITLLVLGKHHESLDAVDSRKSQWKQRVSMSNTWHCWSVTFVELNQEMLKPCTTPNENIPCYTKGDYCFHMSRDGVYFRSFSTKQGKVARSHFHMSYAIVFFFIDSWRQYQARWQVLYSCEKEVHRTITCYLCSRQLSIFIIKVQTSLSDKWQPPLF